MLGDKLSRIARGRKFSQLIATLSCLLALNVSAVAHAEPESQCNPTNVECHERERGIVVGNCLALSGSFLCQSVFSGKVYECSGFIGHSQGEGSSANGVGTGCS